MEKRQITYAVAILGAFAVFLFYAFFPLEWGLMDDTEYVFAIRRHLAENGWIAAVLARISEHMDLDLRAGILRPSFWWYTALAYQLPVRLAYFSRFIEYLTILLVGLFLIRAGLKATSVRVRSFYVAFSLAALLAIRSLYDGVALFSLQEFTGLFFLMIGYWIYGRENKVQISLPRLGIVLFLC